MDRRSLLFVICLSLTLFAVNFYFGQQEIERKRQWHEYQQAQAKKQQSVLEEDIRLRTAPLQDLPLASFKAEGLQGFGILGDGNFLTIAESEQAPTQIQVTEASGREASYDRVGDEVLNGAPLLYRKSGASNLTYGVLQAHQVTDIQIVNFDRVDGAVQIQQALGIYDKGQFSLLSTAPEFNGVALADTPGGYLPVGMYQSQEKSLIPLKQIPVLVGHVRPLQVSVEETVTENIEEKYYVLENSFQQLVFSNKGGALVEINLPFLSDTHPESVVRSIEFDQAILEEHAANAQFPLNRFYTASTTAGGKPAEHRTGSAGNYYPLLRRDLFQDNDGVFRVPSKYYATNIVSDYPEVANLTYEVREFTATKIVLEASQPHRRITKTYEIAEGASGAPYVIDLTVKIDGDSRGLWLTSGVPEVEWISNAAAPALKFRITRQDRAEVEKIALPKEAVGTTSLVPDWICNSNGFFGMIVDPLNEVGSGYRAEKVSGTVVPSRLVQIDEDFQRFKAKDLPGYQTLTPLRPSPGIMKFRLYAGPFADATLKAVDATFTDAETGEYPDYRSSQSFHGYFAFISRPFSKFLFILMNAFYRMTDSWAISIILLTIAVRLMLYPFNAYSMKKMRQAQKVKPLLDAVEEKYKKDPKRAQVEKFNLMREHKVNPAAGCFGMLIQAPFLIGMFDLLKSTFEFRGAPFIHGWIDNLTAPDVLFTWDFSLPFIGNELHLLPLITGGMMYLQSKLTTTLPANKDEWTDAQRQQAMMGPMMAGVFTLLFYNFPSGLNLYWMSSTGLGALQQWYMNRKVDATPLDPVKPTGGKKKGKGGRLRA